MMTRQRSASRVGRFVYTRRSRVRVPGGAAGRIVSLLAALLCAGCPGPASWIDRGGEDDAEVVRGGLSLVEIGERSLETGERLEEEGLLQGALEAYRRALWAFASHERLTGEAPLLYEDARASAERVREALAAEVPEK